MPGLEIITDRPGGSETSGGGKKGNLKKLFKNKYFLLAFAGVSVAGLYALLKNQKNAQTVALTDGYASATQGTIATGASDNNTAYTSDTYDTMYTAFSDLSSQMSEAYQGQFDTMSSQLNTLSQKYDDTANIVTKQSLELQKQNDISAMKNNSDAYHYATTTARKEALHNANDSIASKWGWIFNDDDGHWYDENGRDVLYSTATQEAVKTNVSTLPNRSASGGTYSTTTKENAVAKDIATMKANSEKYDSASASEKQILHDQNLTIASKNGWTFNNGDGYYYDKTGSKVYSPTKTTSTARVIRPANK